MDPLQTVINEIEAIDQRLDEGGLPATDTVLLIAKKTAYRNMLWLLEGRDPSLCFWESWKNREEATYAHNRRITRD